MTATPKAEDARARFDALARTLGLDAIDAAVGATLRPGTIGAPPKSPADARGSAVRTLPRLEIAPRTDSGKGAELELTRLLGEGGMGAVWLARQRSLDRDVAVKRLKESGLPSVPGALALLSEGRATGALEHPSIVPVHALGVDEHGSPLLVMKRIDGASLEALVADPDHAQWPALEQRHGDRLTAKIEILMLVADALELAHARGYVHRDVKPENVMVGSFGEVYLLDWGIALRKSTLTDEERTSVSIVGTPAFMAPEMAYGLADRVDARTDVYLLGATLHAVLTGRPRHEGTTLSAVLLAAILSEPPRENTDSPPELTELVRRSTALEPDERPSSASAFRRALADVLRHRSSTRLAAEAEARLTGVAGEGDPLPEKIATAEATRTLLECRFALDQALRDHPSNEPARRARRQTLRCLALGEIERRSPDAAEAFLRELDESDEALDAQVASLRETLREGRRLEAEARTEARERDPRVAAKQRFYIGGSLLVVGVLVSLAIAQGPAPEITDAVLGYVSFAVNTTIFLVVCGIVALLRARLLATRRARQATATLLLGAGCVVISDGYGLFLSPSVAAAAQPFGMLAMAGVMAGASLAIGRVAMIASAFLVAAGAVMLAWPEHGQATQIVAFLAALGAFVIDEARLAFGVRTATARGTEARGAGR